MFVVSSILTVVAVLLSLPCLVLLIECLAAAPVRPGEGVPAPRPRLAVIVPAHDEEVGIGRTVRGLVEQLAPGDRLVVVADNCSDRTADEARAAGATVVERRDPDRRGKGYAIAFAVEHLAGDPPDVVVLLDADCTLSPDGLGALAARAAESGRPVQAEYLLAAPAQPSPLQRMSALALLVRNRVRPLGLYRLGLPCQLTGSGMAFPWSVLRAAPGTGANLVEDLVMGLELALIGHAPVAMPAVRVSSELPDQDRAALGQRRRWEHGQLATLTAYMPRLVAAGVARGRPELVALAADLMVPPLALLGTLLFVVAVAATAAALVGASWTAAQVLGGALAALAIAVLTAWWRFGRELVRARHLVAVPYYVVRKMPLYVSLLWRGKQKTWERTPRKGEPAS